MSKNVLILAMLGIGAVGIMAGIPLLLYLRQALARPLAVLSGMLSRRQLAKYIVPIFCFCGLVQYAATKAKWTDPVTNYTWSYVVRGNEAEIFLPSDVLTPPPAISPFPEGFVDIPEVLGGAPITRIGDLAFINCTDMTRVSIPDTVASIGHEAFLWCCKLTEVTIPSSVMSIGNAAFHSCVGLTNIVFEGNAPEMGVNVFEDVASGCCAYVRRDSTGWGVDIPGTWQGIRIEYYDPPPAVEPSPTTVENVQARQRHPWNGLVDISFDVVGNMSAGLSPESYAVLLVTATNRVDGAIYVASASALSGDMDTAEGTHHVAWDLNSQGLVFKSDDVVFTVAYVEKPKLYCVIDLSAGADATSYPVSYFADVPSGSWTDEYKTTKLALHRIEPGTFKMCGEYDVTLTKPFYCGVFEVTQKQYKLVTGSNLSAYRDDMRPVESVSYDMIRGSASGSQWPVSSAVDTDSFMGRIQARTGLSFDLPTEAQWEYACRAGTTGNYNNGGDTENDLKLLGRYSGNQSDGKGGFSDTHTTVGSYLPNAWGIYDMHGNVWEWCLDWYGNGKLSGGVTDPVGSSQSPSRVLRGGSWFDGSNDCCASRRNFNYSRFGLTNYGFRIVRTLSSEGGTHSYVVCSGESDSTRVEVETDISLAQVVIDGREYVYDGTAFEPGVESIALAGRALVEGTDFTLAYSDNVDAGIATITLTGTNLYNGTYTTNFTILKATYDMSGAAWNYLGPFTCDGTEKSVEVTGLPPGVTAASYAGNTATKSGTYIAHVTFAYDDRNYNEPSIADCSWTILPSAEWAGVDLAMGFEEYAQGTTLVDGDCSSLIIPEGDSALLRIVGHDGNIGYDGEFAPPFTSAGTNGLSIKTTFGQPCAFRLAEGNADVEISASRSYCVDFLAKFTVLEEPPETTPYSSPKVVKAMLGSSLTPTRPIPDSPIPNSPFPDLTFPVSPIDDLVKTNWQSLIIAISRSGLVCYIDDHIMLWQQELYNEFNDEIVGTNWYVRAGNGVGGSEDYILASAGDAPLPIGDDAWRRISFRVRRAKSDEGLVFNVFIDGQQVRSGDMVDFPSMVTRTSIGTIRFEGQGIIDNIVAREAPPPEIRNVTAKQRWPWNGLVDITCQVSGIVEPNNDLCFVLEAVNQDSGSTNRISHFWVVKDGKNSSDRTVHANGNYRLLWDAHADLGEVVYSNMVLSVTIQTYDKTHDKVQLWANGPYWATTNIGAEKPEDYGYYFWWGDTIGYKRVGDAWVASDGSSSNFSFNEQNTPTYGKDVSALQSEGWITAAKVLAQEHDAAHEQWGDNWRMPTNQELNDLINNCDWMWTTMNGVSGYRVSGRGDYVSASIFFPAAGTADKNLLQESGSYGFYYSSSVPLYANGYDTWSRCLTFSSGLHETNYSRRYGGQPVRPVQGFTEEQVTTAALAGDSETILLDTRTGVRESSGDETLAYSSLWDGNDDAGATVTIAQDGVVIAEWLTGEGDYAWGVTRNGTYELTHTTYTNGVAGAVETATFVVTGKDVPFAPGDVTVTSYSNKYDGAAHGITVASEIEGIGYKYAYGSLGTTSPTSGWSTEVPTLTDVGSMVVWVEVSAPGYITETNSATVTISKRSVTVTVTGHTAEYVYDGSEKYVEGFDLATDDQLYDFNAKTYFGGISFSAMRTDVGMSYMGLVASQFANADANFEVTYVVTDGWLRITQAAVGPGGGGEPGGGEVPEGGESKFDVTVVYDGEGHTIDTNALVAAFGAAMVGGAAVEYAVDDGSGASGGVGHAALPWMSEPPMYTNAGEYVVWYKVTNPNYDEFVHAARVTVARATNAWITEPSIVGWVYGQQPNEPDMGEAKFGAATVSYGATGASRPATPGSYVATFTIAETANYAGLEKTVDFDITILGEGTVTKPKSWKTGQKVTWKAAAAKGSVFAHWKGDFVESLGLSRNALRNPSLRFIVPQGFDESQISAEFISIDDDRLRELSFRDAAGNPLGDEEGILLAFGEPVEFWLVDDSKSYVTASVSGLPAGLKFDAKTMKVTGKPTKRNAYWVQVKAKNASGYQWAEKVRMAVSGYTTEPKEPKLTRTAYHPLSVFSSDTAAGTVTGTGVYAEGKKASISAKPAKGKVFAGWYCDAALTKPMVFASGDYRKASQSVVIPEVRYLFAKFVDATTASDPIVGLVAKGGGLVAESRFKWHVGVSVPEGDGVEYESASLPSASAAKLPAGVKFDAAKGCFTGVPTKAGTYAATITVKNASKSKATLKLTIEVEALPAWAVGTFDGEVGNGESASAEATADELGMGNGESASAEATADKRGTVSLTVSATGKISGKMLEGGRTWTLSAGQFSRVESGPESEVGSPVFYATVIGKAGKEIITNEVVVSSEGGVGVASGVADRRDGGVAPYRWTAWQNLWKRADTKAGMPLFKKNIVVEYPFGEAGDKNNTLKFTFKKDGVVSFSGKIGGVSVSGTSQVVLDPARLESASYWMTLYAPPKKGFDGLCETFQVVLTMDDANAVAEVDPRR